MHVSIGRKSVACALAVVPWLAFADDPPAEDPVLSPPAQEQQMTQPPANPQALPAQSQPEDKPAPTSPPAAGPSPPPSAPAPPPKWSGDLSIGYVRSNGNATASTLNGKFDLEYKSDPWDNVLSGTAFRATSLGLTTDEKYSLADKLLYNFDPKNYLFGQGNADRDRFGAIAQRYSASAGYGRHLINSATQTLDVDLGGGVAHSREQHANHFQTDPIGTFDLAWLWHFAPGSQFKQTLRTEFAANNTYVNPISELKLTLIKNFFVALGYELRYNTVTPAGTQHTDQITTINIGYAFGNPITMTP